MKFQVTLGKTLEGTDLVQASIDLGNNWVNGAGWGALAHTGGVESMMYLEGVFELNGMYKIQYTTAGISPAAYVRSFIGRYSLNKFEKYTNDSYIDEGFSLTIEDKLGFYAKDDVILSDIEVYKYSWNDPLTNQPNMDAIDFTIADTDYLKELYTFLDKEAIFSGDGYTYLLNDFNTNGFCSRIPVFIKYWDGSEWQRYYECWIYQSDVEYERKNGIANVKFSDKVYHVLVKKGMNYAMEIDIDDRGYYSYILSEIISDAKQINYWDAGAANRNMPRYTWDYDVCLQRIIHEATDLSVEFTSFMTYKALGGGNYELGITSGDHLNSGAYTGSIKFTVRKLLQELDGIYNITSYSYLSTIDSNVVNEFGIEDAKVFISPIFTYTYTLDNNNGNYIPAKTLVSKLSLGYGGDSNTTVPDKHNFIVDGVCNELEKDMSLTFNDISNDINLLVLGGTSNIGDIFVVEISGGQVYYDGLEAGLYNQDINTYRTDPLVIQTKATYWAYFIAKKMIITKDLGGGQGVRRYEQAKSGDSIPRVWDEFDVALTIEQLQEIITAPYRKMPLTSKYFTGTLNKGTIMSMKHNIVSQKTIFKIYAE